MLIRSFLARFAACAGLLLCVLSANAQDKSTPLVESFSAINKMAASGQISDALAAVEQALKTRSRDPQWRFLHGLLLAQSERQEDAIAVFMALTEDFPDLPEPHNNLAVLQAGAGKLALARNSLEAAVRADPAYGVAHENLGDIQLRLAIEAYQRAASTGGDRAAIDRKLKELRLVLSPPRVSSESGVKPAVERTRP